MINFSDFAMLIIRYKWWAAKTRYPPYKAGKWWATKRRYPPYKAGKWWAAKTRYPPYGIIPYENQTLCPIYSY